MMKGLTAETYISSLLSSPAGLSLYQNLSNEQAVTKVYKAAAVVWFASEAIAKSS
jgi:hypothetical protein